MTSARALAIVRIAVGATFLVRTTPLLVPFGFRFAESPLVGWPDSRWHLAIVALPAWLVGTLAIIRTIAALSFMLGIRARVAGVVAAVMGYAVLAQDALAYVNTLELLFVSTCLVALADSSTELALRPEPARSMRSGLWLVRAIPISVYVFSAFAKMNAEFVSGRALLGFCEDGYVRGMIASAACAPARAHAVSLMVIASELTLPVLLLVPKTRRAALIAAMVFHATIELAMHPDVFGWLMIALLVSFIPRDQQGGSGAAQPDGSTTPSTQT